MAEEGGTQRFLARDVLTALQTYICASTSCQAFGNSYCSDADAAAQRTASYAGLGSGDVSPTPSGRCTDELSKRMWKSSRIR